jgi:hypothetical protein
MIFPTTTTILLILFSVPVINANKPPLSAKFCSDSECSKDCISWEAHNGICAPGTSSNSWVSSIMTYKGVESGDKAFWQWYGDNSTSQSCAASNLLPTCNATLVIESGCTAVSMCDGLINGYIRLQGKPEDWLIAIIVVFGVIVPCCCICGCSYWCCCRPGACCNKSKASPISYEGENNMVVRIPQIGLEQPHPPMPGQMQIQMAPTLYPPQYGVQYGQQQLVGQQQVGQQPMYLLNYYAPVPQNFSNNNYPQLPPQPQGGYPQSQGGYPQQ